MALCRRLDPLDLPATMRASLVCQALPASISPNATAWPTSLHPRRRAGADQRPPALQINPRARRLHPCRSRTTWKPNRSARCRRSATSSSRATRPARAGRFQYVNHPVEASKRPWPADRRAAQPQPGGPQRAGAADVQFERNGRHNRATSTICSSGARGPSSSSRGRSRRDRRSALHRPAPVEPAVGSSTIQN